MFNTKKILTAALAAATLAGGIAATSEASAQGRYYGYGRRDHDHDDTGAAIVAGIAGLALGAALSSNNRGYYAPSYNSGYYGSGYGYGYAGDYYSRPYYAPPRGYYGRPYYAPRSCTYWQYDRWGRAYQVRGRC